MKEITEIKEPKVSVPIENKMLLTIKEATAYSNIGITKMYDLVKIPDCSFVIHVGNRKLIKRREFEKFISSRKFI